MSKKRIKNGFGRAYDIERANERVKWNDGKTYTRQKPLKNIYKGRKIDLSFSLDKSVEGFYAFIEVNELQPSHLGSAQNPLHFIPEAQPRNRGTSESGAKMPEIIAKKLRPSEICEGSSAYTGAPIVNERGEVIQGNGRAFTMRFYYDSIDPKGIKYKDYFKNCQIANFYGFRMAEIVDIFAKMKNPVLVRMVSVSDEEAIKLGNFQQKDTEAVSKSETDTKARINRIAESDLEKIVKEILQRDNGEVSLKELIKSSRALQYMVKFGVIRADETEKYVSSRGEMNPDGAQFVEKFLLSSIFKDSVNAFDYFDHMPYHTQEGIKKGMMYILSLPAEKSITKEISDAIPEISNFTSSGMPFNLWKNQVNMFKGGQSPQEYLPKATLKLVEKLGNPKTQKEVVAIFKNYSNLVQDSAETMMEAAKKGISKEEALKKIGLAGLGSLEKWGTFERRKNIGNDLLFENGDFIGMKKIKSYKDLDLINAVTELEFKNAFSAKINDALKEYFANMLFSNTKKDEAISKAKKMHEVLIKNKDLINNFYGSKMNFKSWVNQADFTGKAPKDIISNDLHPLFMVFELGFNPIKLDAFFDKFLAKTKPFLCDTECDVNNDMMNNTEALALATAKAKALKLKMKMFESGLGSVGNSEAIEKIKTLIAANQKIDPVLIDIFNEKGIASKFILTDGKKAIQYFAFDRVKFADPKKAKQEKEKLKYVKSTLLSELSKIDANAANPIIEQKNEQQKQAQEKAEAKRASEDKSKYPPIEVLIESKKGAMLVTDGKNVTWIMPKMRRSDGTFTQGVYDNLKASTETLQNWEQKQKINKLKYWLVPIVKETEKAVASQLSWSFYSHTKEDYVYKVSLIWYPKSQVTLKNGFFKVYKYDYEKKLDALMNDIRASTNNQTVTFDYEVLPDLDDLENDTQTEALALATAKAKALKLKLKIFESGLGKIYFKTKKQR